MKYVIVLFLILVLAVPVSAVLTLMLSGFWDWFEKFSGIESIGHSGPADWCYWVMFGLVISLSVVTWFIVRPRKD